MTCTAENETRSHGFRKPPGLSAVSLIRCLGDTAPLIYLIRDLFLIFSGEIDKMVVLGANEERNGSLVEASTLPVPLLDRVKCALTR